MCAVQVTFLKCGGVALGTALHHIAIDAVSAFQFFQTWSAFCRDGDGAAAALERPCHDRTLLRARSPPFVHPDALTVFCPPKQQTPSQEPSAGAVANDIFVLSKDQVGALKRACTGGVSTFCAVSAHVWRCVCAARRLPPDAATRLILPANVRRSLRPPLPDRYFGNGVIMLGASGKVRDIVPSEEIWLASVAGRISGVINRMDDELVRSAIDYLELADMAALPAGSMAETELRMVSWLGMPVYDADFGKPLVMHLAVQQRARVVYSTFFKHKPLLPSSPPPTTLPPQMPPPTALLPRMAATTELLEELAEREAPAADADSAKNVEDQAMVEWRRHGQ
ncbi:hypothetical protein ACQ4PT_065673 [Festuca glaucescens]